MPNAFNNILRQLGLLIVGGLLVATGTGVSNMTSGGTSLPEISNDGTEVSADNFVANNEFNVPLTATGSADGDIMYAAACIPNPLSTFLNQGSGSLVRLTVEQQNNYEGLGLDVYFAKSCTDNTSTGHTVIVDNSCTETGCVSYYTTGTGKWNGADYIKASYNGVPNGSGSTGRIRGTYEDIFGE